MDTALYIKREWSPYYFIRDYEKGDVKLWRIKFRMDPNKSNTKTTVNILSFQTANSKDVYAMDRKRRKEYKTVLEQLFR